GSGDWSSDVCSSDLAHERVRPEGLTQRLSARAPSRAREGSDELGGLRRRRADANALRLERVLLGLSRARRARDDRARVPHRLARRRRETRDVRDGRLAELRLDERGCLLLLVTADLADEDDVLGLRVVAEER